MYCLLEEHPREHFIMFPHMSENATGHCMMCCVLEEHPREHFIMFPCMLENSVGHCIT